MNESLPQRPSDERRTVPPADANTTGAYYSQPNETHPILPSGTGPHSPTIPDLPAGYEFLRELGRGGMGVVYQARDTKLNRIVALKMILAGSHAAPVEMQRFLKEAEAVAAMQHLNIVQIFETGQHAGLPYFTLEFVEGGTLAAKVREHPLSSKEAARVTEQLAHGIAYAHSKGIIHRDLKPENVLLSKEGTPKIGDFGLAKRVSEMGAAAAAELTATGVLMGTPSYMAPEQAAAKKDVGPLADVYALGAILYRLLAGRPPFQAATPLDTAIQVQMDEVIPLRRLNRQVPKDLETICQKCLQKDPRKRYPSAKDLAEDLRRWQIGEPILARPVGHSERAWKWMRRNPMPAAFTVALLIAAVVSTAFGIRAWQKARLAMRALNDREAALRVATSERDRADRREKETRQTIREYFTDVSENPELMAVGLEPLRKKLLMKPRDYYQRFLAENSSDPSLKSDLADAHFRLAQIIREVGDRKEAVAELNRAVDQFRELQAANPDDPSRHYDVAKVLSQLGLLYRELGHLKEAQETSEEAILVLEALSKSQPENTDYRTDLAGAYNILASVHSYSGSFSKEEQFYQKALAIRQALARERPNDPARRHDVAQTLYNLGGVYTQSKRLKPAEKAFREAIAIQKALCDEFPYDDAFQWNLGQTQVNLGLVFDLTDRPAEALAMTEKARDILKRAADAHPSVNQYQFDLSVAYGNLVLSYRQLHRSKEADEAELKCLDIKQKLVDRNPEVVEYAVGLGGAFSNRASSLRDQNQAEKALPDYQRAITVLEGVLKRDSKHPMARNFLCITYGARAQALMQLKRYAEAVADLDRALPLDDGSARLAIMLQRSKAAKLMAQSGAAPMPER
jgi:tetratricopeptide (TPR) repeat protein/tRNA A-37 threonylcarbamoyl transferase component Bud32